MSPLVPMAAGLALGALAVGEPLGLIALVALPWAPRRAAGLVVLATVAGWGWARLAATPPACLASDERVVVRGRLVRPVEAASGGARLELDVEQVGSARCEGRLAVGIGEGVPAAEPGDLLRLRTRVGSPRGYLNGGPDPARLMRARGADASAHVDRARDVVVEATGGGGPRRWLGAVRRRAVEAIERAVPGEPARVLAALVLGERRAPSEATERAYRAAGVTHVLSVSGLHLAVTALFAFAIVRWLLLRSRRLAAWLDPSRGAAVVALVVAAAYAIGTGEAVATLRAALGAGVLLGATLVGRRAQPATALAVSVIALLLDRPARVHDPSLQLSVVSVAGLLWIAPHLRLLGPGWLGRGLRASLGASLATLPLVVHHFGELPLAGPLANLLVVPPLELVALPLALVGLAVGSLVPWLGQALLWTAGLAVEIAGEAASRIGSLVPPLSLPVGAAVATAAVALLLLAMLARRRRTPLCAAAALAALVLAPPWWVRGPAALEAWFLDVGQGDATLVRWPDGKLWLVDAGGAIAGGPDPGKLAVVPALRRLGIARLDVLALSHPHPDHFGGVAAVLEAVDVGALWWNGERGHGPGWARLRVVAERRGVPALVPRGRFRYGGGTVEVLQPRAGGPAMPSTNDASLVLRLALGAHALLLPGDAERAAEGALVAAGLPLRADVLKVPHHGSRTSSTRPFLARVLPQLAVIPAGFRNTFGFPHAEVASRYRRLGIVAPVVGETGAVWVRLPAEGPLEARNFHTGRPIPLP